MVDMSFWKEYYSNQFNLERISNYAKYREIAIIRKVDGREICTRPHKIFNSSHLKYWIDRFNLTETIFDLYRSNISLKLPPLPSNLNKLKEIRPEINRRYTDFNYITAADFLIDIDVNNESEEPIALSWARIFKKELEQRDFIKHPVEIWSTGSGGIHVISFGKFLCESVKNEVMDICCKHSIPMSNPVKIIDGERHIPENGVWRKIKKDEEKPDVPKPNVDSGIYDYRRICRVPYSLHGKSGRPMERVS